MGESEIKQTIKDIYERVEAHLNTFLTLTILRGEWSSLHPTCWVKTQRTSWQFHWAKGWVVPTVSLGAMGNRRILAVIRNWSPVI